MKTLAILLFFASCAIAQTPSVLVENELENYIAALALDKEQGRVLEAIRIRTLLELGINIPGVTNFSVNPEIEFVFNKK